jgi:hypothetical protein
MLDGRCAEFVTDAGEHRIAFGTRVAPHANLDQFVRFQADVDFVQHPGRKSKVADADDWMQVMCLGAKRAALAG